MVYERVDIYPLGRIPTPDRPHYIYALWFEWNGARRYFYIGKAEADPNRVNTHDCTHGAKTSSRAIKGLISAGILIHRQIIDWYPKEDLVFWERYWWTVYKTLDHPLCHPKPGKSCMNAGLSAEERSARASASMTSEQRSINGKKVQSALTPEQRIQKSRLANNSITPEQHRAYGRKSYEIMTPEQKYRRTQLVISSMTPEQRSSNMKKTLLSMTPEQRSINGRKGYRAMYASTTPEQRRANGLRYAEKLIAANASRTPEQRSDTVTKVWATRTPEHRSEIARKVWIKRRLNKGSK
jgi:hypothetical protein